MSDKDLIAKVETEGGIAVDVGGGGRRKRGFDDARRSAARVQHTVHNSSWLFLLLHGTLRVGQLYTWHWHWESRARGTGTGLLRPCGCSSSQRCGLSAPSRHSRGLVPKTWRWR